MNREGELYESSQRKKDIWCIYIEWDDGNCEILNIKNKKKLIRCREGIAPTEPSQLKKIIITPKTIFPLSRGGGVNHPPI